MNGNVGVQLRQRMMTSTIQDRIDFEERPMQTFRHEFFHMAIATAIFFGVAFLARLI